jgi:hypothetical protein
LTLEAKKSFYFFNDNRQFGRGCSATLPKAECPLFSARHRLLGIAPSAEIGAFCRIQTPIAKAFVLG